MVKLSSRFMEETECVLEWATYVENEWNALVIRSIYGEPIMKVSVNPFGAGESPEPIADMIYIKDYSENEGILDSLIKAGVLEKVGEYTLGYAIVDVCRILNRNPDATTKPVDLSDEAQLGDDILTPTGYAEGDSALDGYSSAAKKVEGAREIPDRAYPTRLAEPNERLTQLYAAQDALTNLQRRLNKAIIEAEEAQIAEEEGRQFIPGSTTEMDL